MNNRKTSSDLDLRVHVILKAGPPRLALSRYLNSLNELLLFMYLERFVNKWNQIEFELCKCAFKVPDAAMTTLRWFSAVSKIPNICDSTYILDTNVKCFSVVGACTDRNCGLNNNISIANYDKGNITQPFFNLLYVFFNCKNILQHLQYTTKKRPLCSISVALAMTCSSS